LSLSNYSELRQSIQDWTLREDLSQRTPDFILLVEAELNLRLRVRRMLARDTFTADAQYEGLPSDFLEMARLTITSTTPDKELLFASPQQMSDWRETYQSAGEPIYYSIVGSEVEFLPVPSDSYTVERLYFAEIPALSSSNTTNWLLTSHPEVYLHGCLAKAFAYAMDEGRAALHEQQYQSAVDRLVAADKKGRVGQRPVIRTKAIGGY